MSNSLYPRSSPTTENVSLFSETNIVETPVAAADPTESQLFDLYEEVVQSRTGTRDAEIFEKIRQWTFSDFTRAAHEFAGISVVELHAWQKRNRINLSAGHIRPENVDLERGHTWGQIRMASAANRLHSTMGPPSVAEVKLAWLKKD
jgi:hypothetical protein